MPGRSLGISVFTGMLASTFLAVVFVPAFFVLLQRLDEWLGSKKPPAGPRPAAPLPSIEPTEIAPSD
jgi:hydrophobic/amphiphilic exporter-1 (mainly G- bacteria), HAE1 family